MWFGENTHIVLAGSFSVKKCSLLFFWKSGQRGVLVYLMIVSYTTHIQTCTHPLHTPSPPSWHKKTRFWYCNITYTIQYLNVHSISLEMSPTSYSHTLPTPHSPTCTYTQCTHTILGDISMGRFLDSSAAEVCLHTLLLNSNHVTIIAEPHQVWMCTKLVKSLISIFIDVWSCRWVSLWSTKKG